MGETGPQGPQGETGPQGPAGAGGSPGPNEVSTSTVSNISGLLKGNGTTVEAAQAGVDYLPMNGGTLSGQLQASSTAMAALAVQQVRNIYFGTAEMEDGVSDLPAGVLYFQYQEGES